MVFMDTIMLFFSYHFKVEYFVDSTRELASLFKQ